MDHDRIIFKDGIMVMIESLPKIQPNQARFFLQFSHWQ